MGNFVAAVALSIPWIGWLLMAALLCFGPFVILLKSSQRVVDILMLGVFAACYVVAQWAGAMLVSIAAPDIWILSAIPVLPVCYYFLKKSTEREFGAKKAHAAAPVATGLRKLPSHWE